MKMRINLSDTTMLVPYVLYIYYKWINDILINE